MAALQPGRTTNDHSSKSKGREVIMRNLARKTALVAVIGACSAAGMTGTATAAERTTILRVRIADCPVGCAVQAWQPNDAVIGRSTEPLDSATVRHGLAVLTVPTSATRGLFFIVVDKAQHQAGEGLVGVVLRYDSDRIGRRVSATEAAHASKGYDCWAGTSRSDVTFRFQAQLFPSVVNGFRGTSLRVWSTRAVRTAGLSADTFHGALPKQDLGC